MSTFESAAGSEVNRDQNGTDEILLLAHLEFPSASKERANANSMVLLDVQRQKTIHTQNVANDPHCELDESHCVSPATLQVSRLHFFEVNAHHLAEHRAWWAENDNLDFPFFPLPAVYASHVPSLQGSSSHSRQDVK